MGIRRRAGPKDGHSSADAGSRWIRMPSSALPWAASRRAMRRSWLHQPVRAAIFGGRRRISTGPILLRADLPPADAPDKGRALAKF
eukprot:2572968-Pyramimonas_sp.AAC.1